MITNEWNSMSYEEKEKYLDSIFNKIKKLLLDEKVISISISHNNDYYKTPSINHQHFMIEDVIEIEVKRLRGE